MSKLSDLIPKTSRSTSSNKGNKQAEYQARARKFMSQATVSDNPIVRLWAAKNTNTSQKLLNEMIDTISGSDEVDVFIALIRNPNTSNSAIAKFINDDARAEVIDTFANNPEVVDALDYRFQNTSNGTNSAK